MDYEISKYYTDEAGKRHQVHVKVFWEEELHKSYELGRMCGQLMSDPANEILKKKVLEEIQGKKVGILKDSRFTF